MVDDDIVIRTAYPEVPSKVEYSLRPLGETMRPVVSIMEQWEIEYKNNR